MDGERRVALAETKTIDMTPAGVGERRVRYQLDDQLGSACVELDATGDVITYEEFHPYGTSAYLVGRSTDEHLAKRYRFTGMERDEETGLQVHGVRQYAPWLGRWMSADPAGMVDGLNRFVYAEAVPISTVDRSGLLGEDTIAMGIRDFGGSFTISHRPGSDRAVVNIYVEINFQSGIELRQVPATSDSSSQMVSVESNWRPSEQEQFRNDVRSAVESTWSGFVLTREPTSGGSPTPRDVTVDVRVIFTTRRESNAPDVWRLNAYHGMSPTSAPPHVMPMSIVGPERGQIYLEWDADPVSRQNLRQHLIPHEFGHTLGLLDEDTHGGASAGQEQPYSSLVIEEFGHSEVVVPGSSTELAGSIMRGGRGPEARREEHGVIMLNAFRRLMNGDNHWHLRGSPAAAAARRQTSTRQPGSGATSGGGVSSWLDSVRNIFR
jgi:RHS repeat-associated protein